MENTHDKCQLVEALQPTVDALELKPTVTRRINLSWLKDNLDDTMVERIIGPLPLAKPREMGVQLENAGGVGIFLSEPVRTEVRAWWTAYKLDEVFTDFGIAVSASLKAYSSGKLVVDLHMVAKALATMATSVLMAGSEPFRHDLAGVLGNSSADGSSLIRRYRKAVLAGHIEVVEAIDQRIMSDPMWGPWAENFLDQCGEMLRPQKAITEWIFPETPAFETNSDGIRQWLFRR